MTTTPNRSLLGASPLDSSRVEFRVWAPKHKQVTLHLVHPRARMAEMTPIDDGYHTLTLDGVSAGARYSYRLSNGPDRPDPASRLQPESIHGPSEVVDPSYDWSDSEWSNPPMDRHVIYELHVGTFATGGTFEDVAVRLTELRELGVTAIELMPVAEFPGSRNWGYDGVGLFAAHHAYGGPKGLKRLVNAAHRAGLAVFLDVVYNHLGPEGNYLAEFGPYFTDRYKTPWGPALNFDGADSDEVRRFFIENALYWIENCHIDGLRLDAVHAILDYSPRPFIEELADSVRAAANRLRRRVHLIAESGANDPRLIRSPDAGGQGLHAVWNDDFHHALRAMVAGDRAGYYADYGELAYLAKAMTDGFVYTGQRSAFRRHRHGRPAGELGGESFVVFAQNHDQIGNRAQGDRLEATAGFEGCKIAAGLVILSPFVPLLFMGEEYADPSPFLYFVSHGDADLVESVRRGRREEFASFDWKGSIPDPQSEDTFKQSVLDWSLRNKGRHGAMLAYYKQLLSLRRENAVLACLDRKLIHVEQHPTRQALAVLRGNRTTGQVLLLANFDHEAVEFDVPLDGEQWTRLIDSGETRWAGPGGASADAVPATPPAMRFHLSPRSFAAYGHERH